MKKAITGIMMLYLLQSATPQTNSQTQNPQTNPRRPLQEIMIDTSNTTKPETSCEITYQQPTKENLEKILEKQPETITTEQPLKEYSFKFTTELKKGSSIKKIGLKLLNIIGLVKLEYYYGEKKELKLITPTLKYHVWMEGKIYKEQINKNIKETKTQGEDLFTQAHKILTEEYNFLQEKDRTVKVIYDGAIRKITIHSEKINNEYLRLSTNLEHLGKNNQIKEVTAIMKITPENTLNPEKITISLKKETYEVTQKK